MRLVRHDFGPEGTAYVRSYLRSNEAFGKRLGRLLARRDLEAGTTWALVPADSSPQQRLRLKAGLFPDAGPPVALEHGYLTPKFDPSSHAQFRRALGDLLSLPSGSPRLLCVEWAYGERT